MVVCLQGLAGECPQALVVARQPDLVEACLPDQAEVSPQGLAVAYLLDPVVASPQGRAAVCRPRPAVECLQGLAVECLQGLAVVYPPGPAAVSLLDLDPTITATLPPEMRYFKRCAIAV